MWQKSLQVDESLRIKMVPIIKRSQTKQTKQDQNKNANETHAKEYHPRSSKLSLFPNCLLGISKYQLNLLE